MKNIKSILVLAIITLSFSAFSQSYTLDANTSSIKWNGKKVTGEHSGTIQLQSGAFEVKNNKISSGMFTINMASIANTDIEDASYKAKLEGHLKSNDFFGVEKFPTATLEVKESTEFTKNTASVKGKLSIKGISQPIDFVVKKEGSKFSTVLVIDRSKFDVKYGSGSFFDGLGDKMIYDEFTLTVILYTAE